MTVISYPVPIYQNVPINTSFYKPRFSVISDLTLGNTTTVTTTEDYTFYLGQQVRFVIPDGYGTRGLNGKQGVIVELTSSTEFIVNISTIGMNPFIPANLSNQALVLPIGDINKGAINTQADSMQTFIDGSFINVSPNG